jgi:diadenosine tetraphosphate (Ap4A) HIT family hydrolase
MLSPKRHVAREEDFTEEERLELLQIKEKEMGDYDLILESTQNTKSRPDHFHLHLLRYYRK